MNCGTGGTGERVEKAERIGRAGTGGTGERVEKAERIGRAGTGETSGTGGT